MKVSLGGKIYKHFMYPMQNSFYFFFLSPQNQPWLSKKEFQTLI